MLVRNAKQLSTRNLIGLCYLMNMLLYFFRLFFVTFVYFWVYLFLFTVSIIFQIFIWHPDSIQQEKSAIRHIIQIWHISHIYIWLSESMHKFRRWLFLKFLILQTHTIFVIFSNYLLRYISLISYSRYTTKKHSICINIIKGGVKVKKK